MGTNEKVISMIDEYLAKLPGNPGVPPELSDLPEDVRQEVIVEFITSTTSALKELEKSLVVFESEKMTQEDVMAEIRRIIHGIKGESAMTGFLEIYDLCCETELLLEANCETVPVDTLLSVKAWITMAVLHL